MTEQLIALLPGTGFHCRRTVLGDPSSAVDSPAHVPDRATAARQCARCHLCRRPVQSPELVTHVAQLWAEAHGARATHLAPTHEPALRAEISNIVAQRVRANGGTGGQPAGGQLDTGVSAGFGRPDYPGARNEQDDLGVRRWEDDGGRCESVHYR